MLTVFVTHTLTVFERATFYESLNIDAREYNKQVIEKTNETAARAFPEILNTKHPEFFRRLEDCSDQNLRLLEIANNNRPKFVKFLQKVPSFLSIMGHMVRLFMMKPIDAEATREIVY